MHTDSPLLVTPLTVLGRARLILFALAFWIIAAWMFHIVEMFANGKTWWDFAVKLVIHEIVLAIVLFGGALLALACFSCASQRFIQITASKLKFIASAVVLLFLSTLVLVSLVVPVLNYFKVLP